MSGLGFAKGFENVNKVLAQMLAMREQEKQDQLAQSRFEAQQGLTREQMAQAQAQFDATKQFQAGRAEAEDKQNFLANSRASNELGLRQMQMDAAMRNQVSPAQQHQWELELANLREQGDNTRAALARNAQLEAAKVAAGSREKDPMEQFRSGITGVYGRGVTEGMDPKDLASQLQNYVKYLGPVFGFGFDQQKTHNFLSPGVDPWVRANFGGDYNAAIKGLQESPDTYFKLLQQGIDPSAVLNAVQTSLSDYTAKQRQSRLDAARAYMGSRSRDGR